MAPDRTRYTHPDPDADRRGVPRQHRPRARGRRVHRDVHGHARPLGARGGARVRRRRRRDRARGGRGHRVEHPGRARRTHRDGAARRARDDRHRRRDRVAAQPVPAARHLGPRRRGDEPHVLVLRGRAALDRRGPRAAGPLERRGALQRPRRRAPRPAAAPGERHHGGAARAARPAARRRRRARPHGRRRRRDRDHPDARARDRPRRDRVARARVAAPAASARSRPCATTPSCRSSPASSRR